MRTLVAHEWLAEVGGSENVFEQIRVAVPHCRAVCLWNDNPIRFSGLEETWLARSPLRGHKAAAMPFMDSSGPSALLPFHSGDILRVLSLFLFFSFR